MGRYLKEVSGALDHFHDGLDDEIEEGMKHNPRTGETERAAETVEIGRMDKVSEGLGLGSGRKAVKVVLSDPAGSGLFNKVCCPQPRRLLHSPPIERPSLRTLLAQVKYGVMYDSKESEGKKRRHQVDTVVEGIGINRVSLIKP